MLLKPKHYYRDASGGIHCIYSSNNGWRTDQSCSYTWNKDGTSRDNSKYDLVSEVVVTDVVPPTPQFRYCNIYKDFMSYYLSRERADAGASRSASMERLACVRIEWVDGQFDD
jgi:hypothetical protein